MGSNTDNNGGAALWVEAAQGGNLSYSFYEIEKHTSSEKHTQKGVAYISLLVRDTIGSLTPAPLKY